MRRSFSVRGFPEAKQSRVGISQAELVCKFTFSLCTLGGPHSAEDRHKCSFTRRERKRCQSFKPLESRAEVAGLEAVRWRTAHIHPLQ